MQKARDEILRYGSAQGYYYDPQVFNSTAISKMSNLTGTLQTTTTTGSGSVGSSLTVSGNPYVYTNAPIPAYYYSVDDGWGNAENQAAAGFGWAILQDSSAYPRLASLAFGTKSAMTDQEVMTDVIEQAMSGGCPIAYKILCVLTKNRSPYSDWTKTVEALAETYDSSK